MLGAYTDVALTRFGRRRPGASGLRVVSRCRRCAVRVPVRGRRRLQLSRSRAWGGSVLTRNARATLKKTVPNGTYHWRVRAVTADGSVSPWAAPWQLRKGWTLAPALQAPAHGAVVSHPQSPLVLKWASVPHAAKYLVSIASDPLLGSAVGGQQSVETSGTAYAPRALLLPPGTYYWGVVPVDAQGHRGVPSPVASFTWTWPTSTCRGRRPFRGSRGLRPVLLLERCRRRGEVRARGEPDRRLLRRIEVCCTAPILASSHSPTSLLRDNTYYWRVRALDAFECRPALPARRCGGSARA